MIAARREAGEEEIFKNFTVGFAAGYVAAPDMTDDFMHDFNNTALDAADAPVPFPCQASPLSSSGIPMAILTPDLPRSQLRRHFVALVSDLQASRCAPEAAAERLVFVADIHAGGC